jgi:WD40 repeat protein
MVRSLVFGPDGRWLAGATLDARVLIWDPAARTLLATIETGLTTISGLYRGPDGKRLRVGASNQWRSIEVADWTLGPPEVGAVFAAPFESPAGELTFGGYGYNGRLAIYEVRSGRLRKRWVGHSGALGAVAVRGNRAATAGGAEVRTWTLPGGQSLARAEPLPSTVLTLAFSPAGDALAAGTQDGTIHVFDRQDLKRPRTFSGHVDLINAVTFSPDGTRLVSASRDGTIRFWDVEHGLQVAVLRGHPYMATSLAFSPDGRRLASGGGRWEGESEVLLWEVPEEAVGK